jgi:hypothetical protein
MIDLSIENADGIYMMKLNRQLIAEKNLNVLTIKKIQNLHFLKNKFIKKMEHTDNSQLLYILGQIITTIEFKLQALWGFDLDICWHDFYSLPKCKCPKLDNFDRRGVKNAQIFSEKCPVHFRQDK